MCVCGYIYIYIYIYANASSSLTNTCIHALICMFIYIYTHIHTHAYIHNSLARILELMNNERDMTKRASASRSNAETHEDALSVDLVLNEATSLLATIEGYAKFTQTHVFSEPTEIEASPSASAKKNDGGNIQVFSRELEGAVQMIVMDYVSLEEVVSYSAYVCMCMCVCVCVCVS